MVAKIFICLIISAATIIFVIPAKAQNNQNCRWIHSANNDAGACQRIIKGTSKQADAKCDASTKKSYDNTCCCPDQSSHKYIIIGSLIVVFGLITGYALILKKSE